MNQDTTNAPVSEFTGKTAIDPQGDKVGTVYDIYLDQDSNQPEWLALSTGMFGTKISFVPISGVRFDNDNNVVIAYDKATVKDAPRVEADGQLSEQEERELYAHYGRSYESSGSTYDTSTSRVDTAVPEQRTTQTTRGDNDASVVRSEEEVSVDKHRQEAGRVRLRKYVETENVQLTVPVQRQVARVVRENVREGDVRGADTFTDDEEEIVLSEEVVDVDKRVVAKERVGLETDTVTEQVPVNETVRKERVEVEGDDVLDDRNRR